MSFQDKLSAIFNFSQQVIPALTKDAAKQTTYTSYVGLGLAGVALIEALFAHKVTPTGVPAPVAATPTA